MLCVPSEVSGSLEPSVSPHVEKRVFFPPSVSRPCEQSSDSSSTCPQWRGSPVTRWVLFRLPCVCPSAELPLGLHMAFVTLKSQPLCPPSRDQAFNILWEELAKIHEQLTVEDCGDLLSCVAFRKFLSPTPKLSGSPPALHQYHIRGEYMSVQFFLESSITPVLGSAGPLGSSYTPTP